MDTSKISQKVLELFFSEFSLVDHQIRSYYDFITESIPALVNNYTIIDEKESGLSHSIITLRLQNVRFGLPSNKEEKGFEPITPNEARIRSLTYSMPMYIDVAKLTPDGKEIDIAYSVLLGEIPVMVRSHYCVLWGKTELQRINLCECPVDVGGYFIVNGNERAVILQEKMAINQIFVMKDTKGNFRSEIRSTPNQKLKIPSQIIITYVKPIGKHKGGSKVFRVQMARLSETIPFFVLLRAIYPDFKLEWIYSTPEEKELLLSSVRDAKIEECWADQDADEKKKEEVSERASEFVGSKLRNIDLELFFDSDVLPHIEKTPKKKAMYLCYMLRKLIHVILGKKNPDDRDHLSNKRMETTGMLLGGLFRQLFLGLIQDVKKTIKRRLDHQFPLSEILSTGANIITKGLKYSLATGNWGTGAKDCLYIEETVLMSDWTRKKIKDVVVGDEVVCFDPETCKTSITKVVDQFIKETDKNVYKITTCSGREIIATEDHKFLCADGWTEVGDMKIGETKIGVLCEPMEMSNEVKAVECILTEEKFINTLKEHKVANSLIITHLGILKTFGIIPLFNTDKRLPILARLFGHLCSDGWISVTHRSEKFFPSLSGNFSTELDAESFENDVKKLGLKTTKITYLVSEFHGRTHHIWRVAHESALPSLLISLGILCGKKTEQERKLLPNWIIRGSDAVKREFISAFQGGDGNMIRYTKLPNGKFNYSAPDVSQHSNPLYQDSLIALMGQCVEILNYFGIEVPFLGLTKSDEETNRVQISYRISSNQDNLIKYFKTIGYRYDRHKIINSAKVIEYLIIKERKVKKYVELVKAIREHYDSKKTSSEIAKLMNIDGKYATDIISRYKIGRKIGIPDLGEDNIEYWIDKFEDKAYCIFVPIKSIEEVKEALVSDITVESNNHSFITSNNLLSSNCLRTGVAQLITRLSYVSILSHLRRISSSIGRDGKLVKPRQLHNSYWNYICPSETPEGSSCLNPDETVLMADGSRKKIKDVIVGDEVITFDPETCETSSTRVVHQFIKEADNKVYKLTTISGRKIIATADHKFMTNEGWMAVEDMKKDTKIGILIEPMELKADLSSSKDRKVIDKRCEILQTYVCIDIARIIVSYETKEIEYILTRKNFSRNIDELEKCGLVPLTNDDYRLPILSRIFGYFLAGGGIDIGYEDQACRFTFETEKDLEEFKQDIHKLGITIEEIDIDNKKPSLHFEYQGTFPVLLKKLGLQFKRKDIPYWIIEGTNVVKREFIRGFQGVHKTRKHLYNSTSGKKKIIEQCNQMLRDFGINIVEEKMSDYERDCILSLKEYEHKHNVDLDLDVAEEKISQDPKNLIKFFETIGYRYSFIETVKLAKTVEILKANEKGKMIRTLDIFCSHIDKIESKSLALFVPIESIEEVKEALVSDITVESENHSFIGGDGFLSSNCGIIKNLALITRITSGKTPLFIEDVFDETKFSEMSFTEGTKVFLNGGWIANTGDPKTLYRKLLMARRNSLYDPDFETSVTYNSREQEIRVLYDSGRCIRPLYLVDDGKINIPDPLPERFSDFIKNGVMEYIDPAEEDNALIATDMNMLNDDQIQYSRCFTHCEIDPSTILGISASTIPFPHCDQSPRITYQCLDPDTTVLMEDRSRKRIGDVKVGDKVVTFDVNTCKTSTTKVINQYVRPTDKKIFKITTVSGREIIATGNHNFMTSEGWMAVENMTKETKIGIFIEPREVSYEVKQVECILTEEKFIETLREYDLSDKLISKHLEELKGIGLIPLFNDNRKLAILARIIGSLLTDGSMNIYSQGKRNFSQCQFCFGAEIDSEEFEEDIEKLGLQRVKLTERTKEYKGASYHTWNVVHKGSLPSLLISFGIGCGRKTEHVRSPLPDWIVSGSDIIKREFISAFEGGDGCQIGWRKNFGQENGYCFQCSQTSQQTNPEYKEFLMTMMRQCVQILEHFGIEVSYLKERKTKDDNRIKIDFQISGKHENLIRYFDTIGYRYCWFKKMHSAKVVEYLKFKNKFVETHKKLIEEILCRHKPGGSNIKIANELGVKKCFVERILQNNRKGRPIHTPNMKENTIEKWFENVDVKAQSIFINVEKIEEVENRQIADITVLSENHSFIAGNFLSSNSGIKRGSSQDESLG